MQSQEEMPVLDTIRDSVNDYLTSIGTQIEKVEIIRMCDLFIGAPKCDESCQYGCSAGCKVTCSSGKK
jgi:hypothetical protein